MNYYSMSDKAILTELGHRLKTLRLQQNITQQALAEATLLSVGTIKSLEAGNAKLASIIAVLRELGSLQELDAFIPEITISPLEIAARKTTERLRAGRRQQADHSKTSTASKTTDADW